jgi:hypothetical protein
MTTSPKIQDDPKLPCSNDQVQMAKDTLDNARLFEFYYAFFESSMSRGVMISNEQFGPVKDIVYDPKVIPPFRERMKRKCQKVLEVRNIP